MSFVQGCLLSRAAILTNLPCVSEHEILEQRLGSRRINEGGNRRSEAGRSAAGLDLDRERPWWTSHQHFGVNGRDKSAPACVGSMILRRQARRRIKVGGESGADVIVQDGLSGGEQVIVDGLQRVRAGAAVRASPTSRPLSRS